MKRVYIPLPRDTYIAIDVGPFLMRWKPQDWYGRHHATLVGLGFIDGGRRPRIWYLTLPFFRIMVG